jgi:hypothetical protein
METTHTGDEGNLSDLERRLGHWRPDSSGLDADAMLFAAGAASVECSTGARLWPAACGLLVALSAVLGTWALLERAERHLLAARLGEGTRSHESTSTIDLAVTEPSYSPSASDYLHLRRRAEADTSYQLASLEPTRIEATTTRPPESAVLRARQWTDLLDL